MKKYFSVFGLWIFFVLAVNATLLWVAASGVTSGVKAVSDSCGKEYPVEVVLSGDWFCPEE